MKNLIINEEKITFLKNYYIIQGNNGNHSGRNRKWTLFSEAYNTKKEACKVLKEAINENSDAKYGLTPICIVTPDEILNIIENKKEELSLYNNCFHIRID